MKKTKPIPKGDKSWIVARRPHGHLYTYDDDGTTLIRLEDLYQRELRKLRWIDS